MLTGSSRCRSGGTLLHDGDDFSSSLGNLGDEWAIEEGIVVHDFSQRFTLDSSVESVWVLSSTVVSPNNDIFNIFGTNSSFTGNLTNSSSLIKTGHSSKVLLWNRWSIGGGNESVGISWVSNNANLDSLLG